MLRTLLISTCCLLLALHNAAQPKRELRAAWIATVANIDWPSKSGLASTEQQAQFIRRLDALKYMGCNAVIVQVRPACDVIYPSQIEPWTYYLTGRQGQAPFPKYDPLLFMIEEVHKRNMEFHAWFNPFRALMNSSNNPNPPEHVTHAHPDWIISYGGKSYMDPGIPASRDYVKEVICEVVKRYDIDAVHLDDYFYPYRIGKIEFGDYRSYLKFGDGQNKEDWRRNNVNRFIFQLNAAIKQIKPKMKLGISPFGVWRNSSKDPEGSATRAGQTNYDDLYADVLLWMQKGWIDYLMPQLYWEHGHRSAAFEILLPWWERHAFGRHMYYGLGVYRMAERNNKAWIGTKEILSQIREVRAVNFNSGIAFYSASSFDKISTRLIDSLHYSLNRLPAFPPAMKWLDSIPPEAPALKAIPSSQGTLLQWKIYNPLQEMLRFVVYRFIADEPINLERTEKIICVQTDKTEFLDINANRYSKCTYVVTAMDRLWNESRQSNPLILKEQ